MPNLKNSPLTEEELRSAPLEVTGSLEITPPEVQPISDNNSSITVDGTVSVGNFPASQAVTGTFWQGTQPVSGPLTDAQLRASAVPTSLASLPSLPAGNNNIGDVDVATLPVLTDKASISNNPIGSVSLGNSLGKANVLRTGTLVTSATTADQVVVTYTVTAGKTLYLEYFSFVARLTTLSVTASIMGTISLETPSGTKCFTLTWVNPTIGLIVPHTVTLPEPISIAAGTVIRIVCTPAATTSMTWVGNFGGYEK